MNSRLMASYFGTPSPVIDCRHSILSTCSGGSSSHIICSIEFARRSPSSRARSATQRRRKERRVCGPLHHLRQVDVLAEDFVGLGQPRDLLHEAVQVVDGGVLPVGPELFIPLADVL
eukprot:CAMPEP_0206376278 /NCGR_PEP_ID=MMETSP0294-20121207/9383_1 /ASSEMBLY_ACC=CAM_ASM_000327 /TAXON_ID=39354 /ORGANISM="Heterosigma akashiwo, Strain CCMP2393" /LENGTH=116 /DNA_ID=CAMNT_0053824365 /DNA_START=251 /DNA_END=597 /DNA_ORIENTATION=+